MKILTRRNAMLGWATWKAAKGISRYHRAKTALPNPTSAHKKKSKKKKSAIFAGTAAAIGGVALLKRKRKHKNDVSPSSGTSSSE
jgi:hypothetical protein